MSKMSVVMAERGSWDCCPRETLTISPLMQEWTELSGDEEIADRAENKKCTLNFLAPNERGDYFTLCWSGLTSNLMCSFGHHCLRKT